MLDCDAAGRLTLHGFLQLYHTQTAARLGDTWRDLEALGYDRQLARRDGAAAATEPPPPQAPPPVAPPAAAMDIALAACLPLVRAAKASRSAADVEAARSALDAWRASAPADGSGGGGALAARLLQELEQLQLTDASGAS